MAITADQVEAALGQVEPPARVRRNGLTPLVEQVNRELSAWGHARCAVALERLIPVFGQPDVLRGDFWCETCHVS